MPKTIAEKIIEIQAKLDADLATLATKQAKQENALADMRKFGEDCQTLQTRIDRWQAMLTELKSGV